MPFSLVCALVRTWVIVQAQGNVFDFLTKYAITMETMDFYQTKDLTYLFKCMLVSLKKKNHAS